MNEFCQQQSFWPWLNVNKRCFNLQLSFDVSNNYVLPSFNHFNSFRFSIISIPFYCSLFMDIPQKINVIINASFVNIHHLFRFMESESSTKTSFTFQEWLWILLSTVYDKVTVKFVCCCFFDGIISHIFPFHKSIRWRERRLR